MNVISNFSFKGKIKTQTQKPQNKTPQTSIKIKSQKEYEKLLELKKIYEDMKQTYESDNYKEIMAQRAKYLVFTDKYIMNKSNKLKDEQFDI